MVMVKVCPDCGYKFTVEELEANKGQWSSGKVLCECGKVVIPIEKIDRTKEIQEEKRTKQNQRAEDMNIAFKQARRFVEKRKCPRCGSSRTNIGSDGKLWCEDCKYIGTPQQETQEYKEGINLDLLGEGHGTLTKWGSRGERLKEKGRWLGGKPKEGSKWGKFSSGNIGLKVKTRWMESVVILIIGVAIYLIFNQALLLAAIAMFAFYILFPNENQIMEDAMEAVEKQLAEERGITTQEELGKAAKLEEEKEKGRISAQRKWGTSM